MLSGTPILSVLTLYKLMTRRVESSKHKKISEKTVVDKYAEHEVVIFP